MVIVRRRRATQKITTARASQPSQCFNAGDQCDHRVEHGSIMQAVIDQLKQEGNSIHESDLQHISPCRFEHINKHGKLTLNVDTTWRRDFLRPLRDPSGD